MVGLVGRLAPSAVDLEQVRQRLTRMPEWSRDALFASPLGVAMLYAGDLRTAAAESADAALNTDDRPTIEFSAPRLTRVSASGDKDWFIGEPLAAFYDTLAARETPHEPILPADESTRNAARAGRALVRYALAARRHDPAAGDLAAEVRRLAPEVVVAAETAEVPVDDARRTLADVREAQESVRRRLEVMEQRLESMAGSQETPP